MTLLNPDQKFYMNRPIPQEYWYVQALFESRADPPVVHALQPVMALLQRANITPKPTKQELNSYLKVFPNTGVFKEIPNFSTILIQALSAQKPYGSEILAMINTQDDWQLR